MTADAQRSQGRLKIRWGRFSAALIGALALVGAPVFVGLAALTPMSWWWPLVCFLIAFGTLITLRTWAVQERRQEAWKRAAKQVAAQHEQGKPAQNSDAAIKAESSEDKKQSTEQNTSDASKMDVESSASAAGTENTSAQRGTAAPEQHSNTEHGNKTEQGSDAQGQSATGSDAEKSAEQDVVEEPAPKVSASEVPFDFVADTEALRKAEAEKAAAEAAAAAEDELDADADTEAEADAETEEGSEEAQRVAEATKAGKGWVPHKVPAPGYASKPEAHREKAEPFQAEEEKKPEEVTSIRKSERERAERERLQEALDLDGIMSRRRA